MPSESTTQRLNALRNEVRSSEEKIRVLINTIPVGLVITNQEGEIKIASPAAFSMFQWSKGNLPKGLKDMFVLEESVTELLSLSNSHEIKELTALRSDGSQFHASIRVSPFASTTVPGLLVVVEDVSAKHELEQLRQEFLSMMTHDLRTPLTSLRCFLELISEGVFDGKEGDLKRQVKGTINTSTRLINMINSLLDLHKLEAGRLNICMDDVSVPSIIEQSVESLSALAEERDIPISVFQFPENLMVRADENYTVQVLVNLLSNALKFSDKGSPVTITVRDADEFIKFIVSDKGRGISKEFQSKLFNRFEQARISDARILGGSGLGLAISKAIVEAQGGSIGVESEPGMGCAFWFTLKRSQWVSEKQSS